MVVTGKLTKGKMGWVKRVNEKEEKHKKEQDDLKQKRAEQIEAMKRYQVINPRQEWRKGQQRENKEMDLPRQRISDDLVTGIIASWTGKFGWINPTMQVVHEKAKKNKGKIYFHVCDLIGHPDQIEEGQEVQFKLYVDESGLGAEECVCMNKKQIEENAQRQSSRQMETQMEVMQMMQQQLNGMAAMVFGKGKGGKGEFKGAGGKGEQQWSSEQWEQWNSEEWNADSQEQYIKRWAPETLEGWEEEEPATGASGSSATPSGKPNWHWQQEQQRRAQQYQQQKQQQQHKKQEEEGQWGMQTDDLEALEAQQWQEEQMREQQEQWASNQTGTASGSNSWHPGTASQEGWQQDQSATDSQQWYPQPM
eukprot:gnl/MRDRNA2_/MRDRNA2_89949_c0_seq1.p1 gnl/MRDRNA2_/MRDRNA2_89949_c0~~gnl/MRDRNA2_/MRDRNA2_89949_c0_seq1.p1  ORF type:complete len:364 (+),score=118.50 gnl/MRDRNA2_/MRDRNA2_89949_c0_seq1:100-1191(+)